MKSKESFSFNFNRRRQLDEVTEIAQKTTQISITTLPPTTEIITPSETTLMTTTSKLVETTFATTDKVELSREN